MTKKEERVGELTVVRVFHRSSRGYDEVSRDAERVRAAVPKDGYVVVPKAFVREALAGKPTRNFASEYVRWSLGQNLRAARKSAGLDQKKLASLIGKAQSTVSMSEKGQIRVSSAYVRAVLRACRVPRDWSAKHWRKS
jgi:DNA-binding XRE family transcriptional regulator